MGEHHQLVLAELREDLAEVESRRTELEAAIALLEERIDRAGDALSAMSMPEAILACLSAAGRPLAKRDLMDLLRKGGRSAAKHLSQHVYNTSQPPERAREGATRRGWELASGDRGLNQTWTTDGANTA